MFKQQISEMQAAGILKAVDHATPWINNFVIVNKKQLDKHGKSQVYICMDPFKLIQAIARKLFHYRAPHYIFQKLSQAKMFMIVNQ